MPDPQTAPRRDPVDPPRRLSAHVEAAVLTPGLYLVATPIGAARDITLRALDVLNSADMLAAEDTRVLRHLLDIHGVPLRGRRILSYHDHNGDRARPALLAALSDGASVAYCSDAGTPLVADPGYRLALDAAQAGARVLTVPSAFHPVTGAAHWEVLLRARAIETGCFVLAPAQCGTHPAPHAPDRPPRVSHGRSLVVDPWGRVLADGGVTPGLTIVSLDLSAVDEARSRIPSLYHDRPFAAPEGHDDTCAQP